MTPLQPNQSQFAKRRRFPMPWQERYEKIEASQAPALLDEGYELGVQGPEQSTFLPLVSDQDLDEFKSFQEQEVVGSLEDTKLAQELVRLQKDGATFFGTLDEENQQVGAYGAYNFLTGQLGLNTLEVVFQQPLPRYDAKDKDSFDNLMVKIHSADKMTESTSVDFQSQHWELAFESALESSDPNPQKIARLAASKLTQADWDSSDEGLGIAGEIYKDLAGPESRKDLIAKVATARSASGEKKLQKISSVRALHEAALISEQSDSAYVAEVLKTAAPEDRVYLGLELAKELFPEKVQLAESLVEQSDPKFREQNRHVLLQAAMASPEEADQFKLADSASQFLAKKERGGEPELKLYEALAKVSASKNELTKFAIQSLKPQGALSETSVKARIAVSKTSLKPGLSKAEFSKEVLEATPKKEKQQLRATLLGEFFPETAAEIESWVAFSPEGKQSKHREWLAFMALEKAESHSAVDLLEEMPNHLSNNWDNYHFVNGIYAPIMEKLSETNEFAKVAHELTTAKHANGKHKLGQAESHRALYKAALMPGTSQQEFVNYVLENSASQDQSTLNAIFLEKFYPNRKEAVVSLTRFSKDDNRSSHWNQLSKTALEVDIKSPKELVLKTVEKQNSKARGALRARVELYRLAAKQMGATNQRAKFLADTAEAMEADGERQIKKLNSCEALYLAALSPNLPLRELLTQCLEGSDKSDHRYIRRELGEKFFPKLSERVESLTEFSTIADEPRHWDLSFKAAFDNPNETDLARLAKAAGKNFGDSTDERRASSRFYQSALKQLSAKRPQAKLALQIARNENGEWLVGKLDSTLALFQAGLEPHSTVADMMVRTDEKAYKSDKPYLTLSFGRELLGEAGLSVPPEMLERLERGDLSVAEIKQVYETVKGQSASKASGTEIEVDEDHLVVGDQLLEVDLG